MFFKNKRGISEVISMVLLIVVTLVAVGVLATFLINFTQNRLDKSGVECFDVLEEISIVASRSCFTDDYTNLTIRFDQANVSSIFVRLEMDDGSTPVYILTNGEFAPNELQNYVGQNVRLPSMGGGERIYQFSHSSTKAAVGAFLKGEQCHISDSIDLRRCI